MGKLKWYQSRTVQAAIAGALVAGIFAVVVALMNRGDSISTDPTPETPTSAIPDNLEISVVATPDAEMLHRMQALLAYGAAERNAGNIDDLLVQYVRTPDFQSSNIEFEWHLRVRGYRIDTESAMLVSGGMASALQKCGGAAAVYVVPPGARGDYLSVIIMVSSVTGQIEGSIADIITSFGRRRGVACAPA